MAVKFEFTLEDAEAETLIELLNNERQRMINESRNALTTGLKNAGRLLLIGVCVMLPIWRRSKKRS